MNMERPDSLGDDASIGTTGSELHLHHPLPVLPHQLHHHMQHQLPHAAMHGIPPAAPKPDDALVSSDAALQDAKMSPTTAGRSPSDADNQERWGVAETRAFLAGYNELTSEFRTTKRNRPVWEKLAQRMTAKGYKRTFEQCRNRWKVLSKSYKVARESYLAGHGRRNFEFYADMESLSKVSLRGLLDDTLPSSPPPQSTSTAAAPSAPAATAAAAAAAAAANGRYHRYADADAADDHTDEDGDQPAQPSSSSNAAGEGGRSTASAGKRAFDAVADSARKAPRTASASSASASVSSAVVADDAAAMRMTAELLLQVRDGLAERRAAEADIKAMMAEFIQVGKQLLAAVRQKTA